MDLVSDDVLLNDVRREDICEESHDGGNDICCRSQFIAAVGRCCSTLRRQSPFLQPDASPPLFSAAAAAAADHRPIVHDSAASAANRLFHRMVAMFCVQRC